MVDDHGCLVLSEIIAESPRPNLQAAEWDAVEQKFALPSESIKLAIKLAVSF